MVVVIPMRGRPKDVREEAMVAIAGPVFGGVTAGVISLAGIATNNQLLITLADFGFMINLFNMLPIGDLDGGRVSKAISKYLLLAGLGGGCYLAYEGLVSNPLFYLVLISGAYTTYGRFFGAGSDVHPSYYKILPRERAVWVSAYFGLIFALFIAMQLNKKYMKSVRQIRQESTGGNVPPISEYERKMDQFAREMRQEDPYFSSSSIPGGYQGSFYTTEEMDISSEDFLKSHFRDDREGKDRSL